MTVDANDPRAPYRQVGDDLRHKIDAGDYRPGTRLPSVRQLATDYSVSSQTVQRALRELSQAGLVVAQQGRAFFVRDPHRPIHQEPDIPELAKRLDAVETELRELRCLVERRLGASQ